MKITVFAKTMKTKEGKSFKIYLSRLVKKTGEEVPVRVQFTEGTPLPTVYPVIIEVPKSGAQLSPRKYLDKDGVESESYTLWVREYMPTGEEYVDHSLDDFED